MQDQPVTAKPLTEKQLTVLLAASDVFLEHGFSAATTDMIQQRAGVSKATVYAFRTSKEALFSAVIEHQCAKMTQAVRNILPASGDLEGTLRKLGHAYLGIIFSTKGLALYRVVMGECQRFPELGHIFWQSGPVTIVKMVEEHLLNAVQAGDISLQRTGTHLAARQFVSLLRGESYNEYLTHPAAIPTDGQIERWVEQAVDTFLRAFRCSELPTV